MEPVIETHGGFTVMGICEAINPMDADYKAIWSSGFMPHVGTIAPHSTDGCYYGVYFMIPGEKQLVDMVAGMAVAGVDEAPEGLAIRDVPAAECVVFSCTVATIGQTWQHAYGVWLPASEYEEDDSHSCFECYPPDTTGDDSPLTIHIPIRKRG